MITTEASSALHVSKSRVMRSIAKTSRDATLSLSASVLDVVKSN